MKYKVGDKVKVKSLEWYNANKDADGEIVCGDIFFDEDMIDFLGGTFTIKGVYNDAYYELVEDINYNKYSFTDEMLEDEVVSIPDKKITPVHPSALINAEPDKYDYCTTEDEEQYAELVNSGWENYYQHIYEINGIVHIADQFRRKKTSPETTPKFEVGDTVCIKTDLYKEYMVESVLTNGYRLMEVEYDRLLPKRFSGEELILSADAPVPDEMNKEEHLSTNFHLDEETMQLTPEVKDKVGDMVNHPSHYTKHPSGVECIDIIKWFNFPKGSAIKYIWRCGEKLYPGKTKEESEIIDLGKAIKNIEFEIERIKGL